ncbi:hypothetical protein [Sphingobium baderi]|uniref:Uncharacterized protein n=1 Tax=Sphingobium baderi TaxID=1332080 RepID=A0A0S3F016_9SPHN|nr:hypothetical protein [Sphingobium baderi]ALR20978.1 hypothetical protein ATN00_12375 [Sphingobium baderi]
MANRSKTRDVPADITRNVNISTENQPKGAARNPSDTLDRDEMPRGPLGDARPDSAKGKGTTKGGQPPEDVENRPGVSTVKPEDYPSQQ